MRGERTPRKGSSVAPLQLSSSELQSSATGTTSPGQEVPHEPALQVWSQVVSRPEPGLAVLTMGRRDVSFDQDLPMPLRLAESVVTKLNDQHAYLRLGGADSVEVGAWLGFGISHPCTVFDKWQLIPELDADDRVVGLIRTFF